MYNFFFANSISLIFFLISLANSIKAQDLTIGELTRFPYYNSNQIADSLVAKGWKPKNVELINDSNYVRKTWAKTREKDNVKSFFIAYEFTKDTSENYIIYQFTDRPAFLRYKTDIVKAGYKILTKKGRKKIKKF